MVLIPGGPAGSGPTARRMILGGQLRRLREAKGISREEAADVIRGSASKISRLELGRVGLKERDVTDLLSLYGVTGEDERCTFLDLVRESNQPGWWHRYSDLMPGWFHDYVGLEESASRIQTYEQQFVPGLLQTEGYARSVIARGRPSDPEDEIARRVALRKQRQRILFHPAAPRLWAVIDESVLHRPTGGRAVLRDQLLYLLEITKQSNIALQIVPFRSGGSAAESAFTLLRFAEPELPDIVYVEHLVGALYLDKPEEIEQYSKLTHVLAVEAMTPDRSRTTIAAMLRDL